MESAKLEAQINEHMSELSELNFGDAVFNDLSKVIGEVVWARSLEFEYPLSDFTPDEIEKFAKAYIQKGDR